MSGYQPKDGEMVLATFRVEYRQMEVLDDVSAAVRVEPAEIGEV